ncbi:F-box only protein 47-like isoform X2 [Daphnia magna]|uniref:F-box only protein 47-like isoform X2 n=1 Tax=Daphnia magna TaxID=35525 RepID=UPI001E1BDA40|nr:F-box only protein 47-like isoform X2 [Daphnia magna]
MTDKIQPMASSTKGVKHALETAISKFTNATIKKRKVMAEMQINQYLAPGLEDSLFGKLTEEVMFHILHRLSLNDLSQMSMASKAFGKVIYAYVTEEQFAMRVARLLIQIPISSVMLLEQVQRLVEKESANSLPIDTLPFVGAVLQSFIAGWDEGECLKVFTFMSDCLFLYRSISRFVCDAPGTDLDNELFLRRNLRYLFLDRCVTDYDRAIWIGFISNQIGTAQLAKVLLLLYCPINTHGQIDWSFAFNVRAFQQHTNVFFKLAKTIGILQLIPNWSPSLSLEVLVYISNVPNCWLLRSFSSVLLPLSSIDMNLVVKYFEILYKSGRASTASLLMALALMISPQFIGHNFRNEIVVDRSCVHQLISNIINAPRLTPERYVVVKKLWGAVLTLADDFAETAVQDEVHGGNNNDTIDDFHDLMDAWKDLSIILMSV